MGAVLFSRQMVSDFLCERHFFQFYRRFLITIKVFSLPHWRNRNRKICIYVWLYIPYEMYFVSTLVLTSSEERNFQEIFQVFFVHCYDLGWGWFLFKVIFPSMKLTKWEKGCSGKIVISSLQNPQILLIPKKLIQKKSYSSHCVCVCSSKKGSINQGSYI